VKVYRSVDSGQTFEKFFVRTKGDIFEVVEKIVVNSADSVFVTVLFLATSLQATWRSGDGGQSWTYVFGNAFSQMVLAPDDKIYGSLSNTFSITVPPTIRVSTDQGDTWSEIEKRGIYGLTRNAQGHLFAGTFDTGIDRSTDGGATWSNVFFDGNATVGALHTTADQKVHAIYGLGYASSDSNGENWAFRSPPGIPGQLRALTVSGNEVFAGFLGTGIWRTSDAGITWTQMDTTGLDGHLRFTSTQEIGVDPAGHIWLSAENDAGSKALFRSTQAVVTAVEEDDHVPPNRIALLPNFPNPFSTSTEIRYQLPEAARVRLVVFNVLGQEVATLIDGVQTNGLKSVGWDGRNNAGVSVPNGTYFYRIISGNTTLTRSMVLTR